MTPEVAIVLAILFVTVVVLMTEALRVDVVAVLVMGTLVAMGLLTPEEGIEGFANPATVTVGAMFILSAGLQRTGAVNTLGRWLLRVAGRSQGRLITGVMLVVAGLSAFINNTAAVAVLMPLALRVSREMKMSPSKLLMPLSFAAMFGGVTTLIGTSTNILVSAIADQRGVGAFGMFEFLPLGLVMVGLGMLYMLLIGRHLIPERQSEDNTVVDRYDLRHYLTEVIVLPGSPLVGWTLEEAQLGLDFDLNIVDIIRGNREIPLPSARRHLRSGDVLLVSGNVRTLLAIVGRRGWKLVPEAALGDLFLGDDAYTLAEAVVAPGSSLVGQTLRSSGFRRRYGAVVLGMQHHGALVRENLANQPLAAGDLLLLYGERENINQLHSNKDFLMLADVPDRRFRRRKAPVAIAIVAAVVLLAALELLPIVIAAVLGCVAMVLTGVLKLENAYDALDAQVLVMLAGILSLGVAMEKSGTAAFLADLVVDLAGPYGLVALLSAFYLMTSLLTEMMSNNAAAALLAPIAISLATGLDVNPRPFLIAVTFAASSSFMTPIGYQTNTMIYGPGGYRFSDFTRVGAPLNILFWIVATLLIPVFWPF
ncbi:MAG: SLC13 family permease [Chloroflexota bacterium]|nr:SLC13 family permease [Chloroflexota bacterium]